MKYVSIPAVFYPRLTKNILAHPSERFIQRFLNNLPAGAGVPFVHAHKKNEEIYIILSGKGTAVLDGETVEFSAGDVIKVAPKVKRQFSAASDSPVSYACIQVREHSLEEYTGADAVIE